MHRSHDTVTHVEFTEMVQQLSCACIARTGDSLVLGAVCDSLCVCAVLVLGLQWTDNDVTKRVAW